MISTRNIVLKARERTLLKHLETIYTDEIARTVLAPMLTQKCNVSLRALDWLVTNYSKKYNVVCSSAVPGQITNIHYAYRTCLSHWKRRLFDPFRRRDRVHVHIDDVEYETTLGQINFLFFCYQTGILAYAIGHIQAIETDMNEASQKHKRERREMVKLGKKRRREELTQAPKSLCVAYRTSSRVVFDGRSGI